MFLIKPFFIFLLIINSLASYSWQRSIETQKLYNRLYDLSYNQTQNQTYLGLQNAYVEGIGWKFNFNAPLQNTLPDSDLKKVIGKNPSLIAYDFNEIGHWNENHIKNQIKLHHQQGGFTTISWHMNNPTPIAPFNVVGQIMHDPNTKKIFLNMLNPLIKFLKDLKDVPIIFRPFHEHNKNWFWWGAHNCNQLDFINLWRLTIDYLKMSGINNILIAYSPSFVESDYLDAYPGHNYVDIMGTDMYFETKDKSNWTGYSNVLKKWRKQAFDLQRMAKVANKIPAITEFGNEGLVINNFWTDFLEQPLLKETISKTANENYVHFKPLNFAYVMLWRNAYEKPGHFFAPYPGQKENKNFLELLKRNFLILSK